MASARTYTWCLYCLPWCTMWVVRQTQFIRIYRPAPIIIITPMTLLTLTTFSTGVCNAAASRRLTHRSRFTREFRSTNSLATRPSSRLHRASSTPCLVYTVCLLVTRKPTPARVTEKSAKRKFQPVPCATVGVNEISNNIVAVERDVGNITIEQIPWCDADRARVDGKKSSIFVLTFRLNNKNGGAFSVTAITLAFRSSPCIHGHNVITLDVISARR